ncbi:hypothetical protein NDU88_001504 [Pleurodeles waltl]|uniref:Uncharacterized protein n=1 Tax=Pleurodeles waltl TaxID=8319 RepID=A0AAV7T0Q5_PLEWA|nr:hypothetical protein NDU88_001504 [Pleurodeles waltl]
MRALKARDQVRCRPCLPPETGGRAQDLYPALLPCVLRAACAPTHGVLMHISCFAFFAYDVCWLFAHGLNTSHVQAQRTPIREGLQRCPQTLPGHGTAQKQCTPLRGQTGG